MAKELFAVVRWLNDRNQLSVHNQKYFLEPKKDTYIPGDEGLACYPGFPGKWQFRVLAVGGKKMMNAWLDSNFNSLMVDVNDTDFVAAAATKQEGPAHNKKQISEDKQKEQNDGNKKQINEDKPKEQNDGPEHNKKQINEDKLKKQNDGNKKQINEDKPKEQNDGNKKQINEDKPKEQNDGNKKQINEDKQKKQNDAIVQKKAQKDLAESLLSKRTPHNEPRDTHKDCVSMKDFLSLKEEVRRLKKKLAAQDLKTDLSQSTDRSQSSECSDTKKIRIDLSQPSKCFDTKQIGNGPTPRPKSLSPKKQPQASPRGEELQMPPCTETLYNNNTKSELEDCIAHIDKVYPAVKTLMLKLFPESYIVSHSVSGKSSNSKSIAKPPFDSRLYNIMVTLIKEKFKASSSKEITEKVHSVQKWVQTKMNK